MYENRLESTNRNILRYISAIDDTAEEKQKAQLIFLWDWYLALGLLLASMILRKKYWVSWKP